MHKELIGQTEFTFKLADSPELLNEIFRLRFQVYCKECNFIKEEDYPEGTEKDKYDAYALHFVAEDKLGVIGAARLILNSELGFPLEEHCNGSLNIDKSAIPSNSIAEISRLVISKHYRRRRDDGLYYSPDFKDGDSPTDKKDDLIKRIRPMTFGIYREMYQECKRRGITHWYALMEKSLWLLLRIHGFVFEPIGKEVDFYGPVRPYLAEIKEMEKVFYKKHPQFLNDYFLNGLEPQFRPKFST